MNLPDDLKYHEKHTWVKQEQGILTIGITDYAQDKLNDIVFLELPGVGDKIEEGKSFANIESVKSVSEVIAPVSGEITEVNTELADAPDQINTDCYNAWLIKVKPDSTEKLISKEEYEKLTQA